MAYTVFELKTIYKEEGELKDLEDLISMSNRDFTDKRIKKQFKLLNK